MTINTEILSRNEYNLMRVTCVLISSKPAGGFVRLNQPIHRWRNAIFLIPDLPSKKKHSLCLTVPLGELSQDVFLRPGLSFMQ